MRQDPSRDADLSSALDAINCAHTQLIRAGALLEGSRERPRIEDLLQRLDQCTAHARNLAEELRPVLSEQFDRLTGKKPGRRQRKGA